MKISKIYLYDEPSVPEIQLSNLVGFLEGKLPVKVETRKNIFKYSKKDTAKKIASCRIYNIRKPFERHTPTPEEIDYEEFGFIDSKKNENIVMYDGFEILTILQNLIPNIDIQKNNFHIFFTNKLTCTFDYSDYRYHGRALIASNPSIVSTTGIIEAPAKPKEYYLDLISHYTQGLNVDTLKKKYSGTYLEYHDKRLSEVVKGYLLQAIFYYLTGEAFCFSKECRLYNAHWQKDLLYSQLEIGKLCDRHQKILHDLDINLNS